MTAKEALHERIEHLSDEEAQELLGLREWESTEDEELTPEEGELVRESRAEYERGDVVDGEKLFRSWAFNHLSADALPQS